MTTRSLLTRNLLHWVGTLLAIAGIAFVVLGLRDHAAEIDFTRFDWSDWLVVGSLALVSGLANLLLALAWWNLLNQFGACTSLRRAVKLYGLSQIAKYVPGNVMHLAGRQALGLAVGLPGWLLAKSTIWELGLIAVAGGIFSCLALPLLVMGLPVTAGLTLFLVILAGVAALLWCILGPQAARALFWYAVFLAISGLLFVVLIKLLNADFTGAFLPLIGAYVLAWLAGLLTPGAPAGVGVRELVLLFLLNGVIGEAELLLVVVLGRLVTVGGDLSFFSMALVINEKDEKRV